MDILWPVVGIGMLVCFALCILGMHWHRTLRQHGWMLRRLIDRVELLEEFGGAQLRQQLGETAPLPLSHIFTLSFSLSNDFWLRTLPLEKEDWDYVRMRSSFVGSVKLECWRSHTVATVTEVLPASETAKWQTRSFDFFPDAVKGTDALTLWETRLARPDCSPLCPPTLALVLRRDAVELCGRFLSALGTNGSANAANSHSIPREDDAVFFRVPLDKNRLALFRAPDPADTSSNNGNGDSKVTTDVVPMLDANWQSYYAHQDEALGVEWQIRLKDLAKKVEWEQWRALDANAGTSPGRGSG